MRRGRWHGVILGFAIGASIGVRALSAERAATPAPVAGRSVLASKIEDAGCHTRAECGSRIRGGLRITYTGWACTTGFVARDATSNTRFVLTAGHCVAGSGLTAQWSHHGNVIGRAALQGLREGSSADVGAIAIDPTVVSNEIIGSGPLDRRTIAGVAPDSSQAVGSSVCRSGATSGWGCGRIIATDVDADINGTRIRHGWWIDIPSAPGDSGAPVVDARGRAAGIVIGTTATRSLYSTVDGIDAELGLRPCLDPSCD
jgi:streptogrisin C